MSSELRFTVLPPADVERVHALSLQVLARTGIVLHYPPARELLKRYGAWVDEVSQHVRIPPELVIQALGSTPRQVTVYAQDEAARDCQLRLDGRRYARPPTGLNWIVDHRATQRRPVTGGDAVRWTRLIQALPHLHLAGSLTDQQGAPTSAEVRCLARMLEHTDKPLMFSAGSGEGMRWLARLAEVTQSPSRRPRLMVLSSVNSPLLYGWGQCEAAMVSAEVGIPVCVNSSAVAGVTGPVTLAGNVVQMSAEMLAALTIVQLHRPGAPVVWAAHPMAMDMRTGMASISVGEVGLMSAACVQLGRHHGLPTSANGVCTDACTPDPMATLEKWACGYLPYMAGANVNAGAGSLACVGTVSLEQLVLDDDLYGHFLRQARGLQVSDQTLAGDVIARVGPASAYLMDEHTLTHFRAEHYFSSLANRLNPPAWEAAGAKDAVERAAETVQRILGAPAQPCLSDDQRREVQRLLARAEVALRDLEARN